MVFLSRIHNSHACALESRPAETSSIHAVKSTHDLIDPYQFGRTAFIIVDGRVTAFETKPAKKFNVSALPCSHTLPDTAVFAVKVLGPARKPGRKHFPGSQISLPGDITKECLVKALERLVGKCEHIPGGAFALTDTEVVVAADQTARQSTEEYAYTEIRHRRVTAYVTVFATVRIKEQEGLLAGKCYACLVQDTVVKSYILPFREWADESDYSKPVDVIDDGSTDNEHRVGAVKDLLLAISDIDDDILVIAADNLLDFSLSGFLAFFKEKGTSAIMSHYEPSVEALRRTGVVVLDADRRVVEMAEKPQEPRSNWAVPPFYCYSRNDLHLIRTCIANGCGSDAPGNLAHYLCERTVVHAYEMPGHRIDIGDLETYRKLASE